jgi:hypothetical protein
MADPPSQIHFDVFLSHNSRDKAAVIKLAQKLQANGVKVWLDVWELRPGQPWQDALADIIATTRAAAVLVSKDGIGPWEDIEMRACLDEFVKRRLSVIPVLLPGCPEIPTLPLLLRQFTWVDCRDGVEEEVFSRLVWGITGVKPAATQSANLVKQKEKQLSARTDSGHGANESIERFVHAKHGQETVLGPIALEDALEYFSQQHSQLNLQVQNNNPSQQESTSERLKDVVRYLWLRSHGNFSALVRMSADLGIDTTQSTPPVNRLAVPLADSVQALWNAEAMQEMYDFTFNADYFDKLDVEWACIWIRSGMIDLANHFLKPSPSKPEPTPEYFVSALPDALDKYFKQREKNYDHQQAWAISAIQTGDPQLLRLVGEHMLYLQLRKDKRIVHDDAMNKPVRFSS